MGYEYDLSKAQDISLDLSDVTIANPVSVSHPDPMQMAKSLSLAVTAKIQVGKKVSDKDRSYWIAQGKIVRHARIGRCDQCAAAVISMICEDDQWTSRVELVGNGHHHFVVCNRNPCSDIRDPINWGAQAFVIDIWLANQDGGSALIAPRELSQFNFMPEKFFVTQEWDFWYRLDRGRESNAPW